MKHAYIITANSNFSVLKVCLSLIDDERNDIYLMFDKKAEVSDEVRCSLESVVGKSVIVTRCNTINWGGVFSNKRNAQVI